MTKYLQKNPQTQSNLYFVQFYMKFLYNEGIPRYQQGANVNNNNGLIKGKQAERPNFKK